MKKRLLATVILVVIFSPFFRYLIIPYAPQSIHRFFYLYGIDLFVVSVPLLLGITIYALVKKNNTRILSITWAVYLILFSTSSLIEHSLNTLVYNLNKSKLSTEQFVNPVLGMYLEKGDNNASFKFNDFALIYEAIVYQPNHGWSLEANDTDASVRKIYDENWYKFRSLD